MTWVVLRSSSWKVGLWLVMPSEALFQPRAKERYKAGLRRRPLSRVWAAFRGLFWGSRQVQDEIWHTPGLLTGMLLTGSCRSLLQKPLVFM